MTARRQRRPVRWRTVRAAFRKNSAKAGLALVIFILALVVYANTLDPYGPRAYPCFSTCGGLPPFTEVSHPFGTTPYGQDMFSEIAHSAQGDLSVTLGATAIAVLIGTLVGIASGYRRGLAQDALLSFIQIVLLLPSFALVVWFYSMNEGTNLFTSPVEVILLVLLLGVFTWPPVALVVRSAAMTIGQEEFILGAKALGAGRRHMLFKHILPNVGASVISIAGIVFATNLSAETLFVYLGLVPDLEHTALVVTWGILIREGSSMLLSYWWVALFPGFMIVITVVGFSLLGDAFYEAFNPSLRGKRA